MAWIELQTPGIIELDHEPQERVNQVADWYRDTSKKSKFYAAEIKQSGALSAESIEAMKALFRCFLQGNDEAVEATLKCMTLVDAQRALDEILLYFAYFVASIEAMKARSQKFHDTWGDI